MKHKYLRLKLKIESLGLFKVIPPQGGHYSCGCGKGGVDCCNEVEQPAYRRKRKFHGNAQRLTCSLMFSLYSCSLIFTLRGDIRGYVQRG